jgi:hypothetical protein
VAGSSKQVPAALLWSPLAYLRHNQTLFFCFSMQHTALGDMPAGTHDIEQDLHTLPNGTYSVVVQAGSERVAKLLQVLR